MQTSAACTISASTLTAAALSTPDEPVVNHPSAGEVRIVTEHGIVRVPASRAEVERHPVWRKCFSGQRKDHRFYGIVEETIVQGFDYRYFVLEDAGVVRAIQPFFILDQDLLTGSGPLMRKVAAIVRKAIPRFLTARTLMVGSAVGEGHLGHSSPENAEWAAVCLHSALNRYARQMKCAMVVMKEFPSSYRQTLSCMSSNGYARVPSLPFTRLHIGYDTFEQYMSRVLSKATRKDLHRKFRAAARSEPIEMSVMQDITSCINDIYPLYLQVYERSTLRFEKLTREFLCRLGQEMPDKVRFFVWRQKGKAIAFSVCMLQGDSIYDEYVGLDYAVALDLHLYFYTLRDIVQWGMQHGFRWYCSSAQNYDPKVRLKSELMPMDLYVRHTAAIPNFFLRRVLPLLEPTRSEPTLRRFPNYHEIWGDASVTTTLDCKAAEHD